MVKPDLPGAVKVLNPASRSRYESSWRCNRVIVKIDQLQFLKGGGRSMTRLFKVFILALGLLMMARCGGPTSYQKADDKSGLGYSDYQVKGNIYYVYVSGVPVSDKEVYRSYWHRRSKELCEGMGFQGYRIIEVKQVDGDPTPMEKSSVFYDRDDPRNRPGETLRDYSRPASVSGKVECLKKSK